MDPDLTSVLNTLSALSGHAPAPAPSPTPVSYSTAPPAAQPQPAPNTAPALATATATARTKTPASAAPAAGTAAPPDPTKITTWPPALRYITAKTQHPPFQTRIKHLVTSQRAHERKWWEGREAVGKRVREREGRRGEVEGVLYVFILPFSYLFFWCFSGVWDGWA